MTYRQITVKNAFAPLDMVLIRELTLFAFPKRVLLTALVDFSLHVIFLLLSVRAY